MDPPRIKKPRSRSLDTEGVRLIQVRFAAMMKNRWKDGKESRRGSQTLGSGSVSPSRSPLSKVFGSMFKDNGSRRSSADERRSSLDDDLPPFLTVTAPEERRLSVPRTIPININPQRPNSARSSPSSPSSVIVPSRRLFPPPPNSGIRPYFEDRESIFGLPPGTRKRTLSGSSGVNSSGTYGDYIRTNFPTSSRTGSPIPISVQMADETSSSSEEETDTFEEYDAMIYLQTDNDANNDDDCKNTCDKHEKGQLVRRHSMEPERKRNGSGSTFGHTYLRGEDPNQAAIIFRDCRGLPAAAPFLENVKRSELEEDESQILVKFFQYHTTYDLIPTSAKLVIFDTRLQVKKAFYALVYNGVRAAPLWDAARQEFVGMLTITDFIRILQSFYNSPNRKMEELEEHRLELWRTLLNDDVRKLISITPYDRLYEAIRSLIHHKIHRLPVIDPVTGNVLYIITHKRILKFLFLYINELPKPSIMLKSLRELNIGTYENIETAKGDTLIIEALNKFVERRISALPIVDDEGKLIDIYAKFDVINLAAEGTYHNLDVTLQQANEYRNEWFEGVLKCNLDETMEMIMERIVRAEVHRLVVVDKDNKVIGIISLSDILNELVLKPCDDDPASLKNKTIAQMESALSQEQSEDTTKEKDPSLDDSSEVLEFDVVKRESEESVAKSWESSEPEQPERKEEREVEEEDRGPSSSSAESIEDRKFEVDVTKISEAIGKQEIGPISG